MNMKKNLSIYLTTALTCLIGTSCGVSNEQTLSSSDQSTADSSQAPSTTQAQSSTGPSPTSGDLPTFSLAWSEYPSWSVFGVAEVDGLLNGKAGELGTLEEKWQVDVVLHESDYDTCITMYGSQKVDAACLTNMDALNPSISRPSTMILPTSTSHGADACIVVDSIQSIADLKGKKVYGLEKSVSEYCFVRNLEIQGQKEKDYAFSNMDPAAAAAALQQKQAGVEAIMVWNPFVMETLSKRSDVKVLFDSTSIPNEIIDAVIMSQDSLKKEGGEAFACAIIDAFYQTTGKLNDPETREGTLSALGEKFSGLDAKAMNQIVHQTKFLSSPGQAIELYASDALVDTMKRVTTFCVEHEITGRAPTLSYGRDPKNDAAEFIFDAQYVKKAIME